MRYSLLTLAGLAAAQAPGGGIPAGLTAPNVAGFTNPTIHPSRGGKAVCVSGNVSVYASTSKNIKLNFDIPANQSQVTQTFIDFITNGSPFTQEVLGGMQNVSGTYNISSTLCMPGTGLNATTIQILTHGIGFDRTYWDFAPGYSYVDVAADNGQATFFYDRLGVGKSDTPDPINVVQGPFEVEIANNLINMLRNGTFSGVSFQDVVGVGHSFGSVVVEAVTANYPASLDAAILTGFSLEMDGMAAFVSGLNLAIASENQPYRFSNLNNGYLVSHNAISNQLGFYHAPNFDPNVLSQAEATKGTVTFGELLTLSTVAAPAMNFAGPLAVVNGDNDLPFCFGNCSYPSNLAEAVKPMLYPMVSNSSSSTYLVPKTGHGINQHYSAGEAFSFIQNFIKSHGF